MEKMTHRTNNVRLDGDTAYIALTDRYGDVVGEAIVDAADVESVLARGRWRINRQTHTNYAICHIPSASTASGRTTLQIHRFLTGAEDGLEVDHVSGDGLDNRRANLDVVSRAVHATRRQGADRDSQSGVRGVFWRKDKKKFESMIMVFGRQMRIGYYADLADATAVSIESRRCLMPFTRFSASENEHESASWTRQSVSELVADRLTAWAAKHGVDIPTGRIEAIQTIREFEQLGGRFERGVDGWKLGGSKEASSSMIGVLREQKSSIIAVLDTTREVW